MDNKVEIISSDGGYRIVHIRSKIESQVFSTWSAAMSFAQAAGLEVEAPRRNDPVVDAWVAEGAPKGRVRVVDPEEPEDDEEDQEEEDFDEEEDYDDYDGRDESFDVDAGFPF